jgi:cytochrome d ubiquinol oxidase subunit I
MDVLTLSRWQFAITSAFHFIFVPLTLGLSILTAWMESKYVRTGDEMWLRMTKFWGKLFLINFALGIVTGITMEFQFGMNWAEYSKYVGDIFGAPLAIEATLAFFLESVFIGLWVFGWNKISKGFHAVAIWIVAIASNLSALWILLANGWMQQPVGYLIRNGRAEMVDFGAMLTNPNGWFKFIHTVSSGYILAAFFVMGIAAWHLVRKNETVFFTRSFKTASRFAVASTIILFLSGAWSAEQVAKMQPAKLAAMESQWETINGAPYTLLAIPDPANERNTMEALKIPKLLSLLSFYDANAEVKGLKAFPKQDRPPVWPVFISYRIMLACGGLMTVLMLGSIFLSFKKDLGKYEKFLKIMVWAIPLPYLAGQTGWIVAEVGRQPWIVYNVLRTSDAVSHSISTGQVIGSLIGFTLLYGFLGIVDIVMLTKFARKGPVETDNQPVKTEAQPIGKAV